MYKYNIFIGGCQGLFFLRMNHRGHRGNRKIEWIPAFAQSASGNDPACCGTRHPRGKNDVSFELRSVQRKKDVEKKFNYKEWIDGGYMKIYRMSKVKMFPGDWFVIWCVLFMVRLV